MSVARILLAVVLTVASACTAVRVQPLPPSTGAEHVCILENPKVIVSDFVPVLREGFARHGVSTEVYSGDAPATCSLVATYTARQSWDFTTYLSRAEIRLVREGREVAYAEYHLRGKGGLSLTKFQGTKAKMDPVIDRLLAGRTPAAAPAELTGTAWRLEALGGTPVLDTPAATLEFPAAGKVSGNGSCNRFTGAVEIAGQSMTFGRLAATRMACAEPVASQEAKYLAALQGAERFVLEGTRLSVYVRGMDEPLRFVRTRA